MDHNLKFLIELYADSKIKQIRKNSFMDEGFEKKLVLKALKQLIEEWVQDHFSAKDINTKELERVSQSYLNKEALNKINLIKKIAGGEDWYSGEQDRPVEGFVTKIEVDEPSPRLEGSQGKYKQLGNAISLLLVAVTVGGTGIDPMVDSLIRKIQELDVTTTFAVWTTPMILGMMIDAFKKLK